MQVFNQEQASSYDERYARLAPQRDGLHLLIKILFSDLPDGARVLCVGAGTGAEVIALAREFPTFQFMAVDPSQPMLEICQRRAVEEGVASRCAFHNGFLETLPLSEEFDAATSLLVSQFLTDRAERVRFFEEIARRLRRNGVLVNADLAGDLGSVEGGRLKEFWQKMLVYSGASSENALGCFEAWKRHVGVLPPDEVEAIISSGGFERPTLIYQSLFIHAWHARRVAG